MKDSFLNKKFKYTFSNVYLYLILTNVFVFMLTNYSRIRINGLPLVYWLSLIPMMVNQGWVWQLFTYMFVHGSLSHLFFNMFALLMFGGVLERKLGSREFLLYYIFCGLFGGVVSYISSFFMGGSISVCFGASGAIYALLFLTAVFFPDSYVLFFYIIPMRMPLAVMVYIAIEIFSQVFGMNQGVAHLVHLSSIVGAWLYCVVRFKMNPIAIWRDNS